MMASRALASTSFARSLTHRTLVRCSSRWYGKLRQEADTWPRATCGTASSLTPVLPPASAESLQALRLCQPPAIPPESSRYIRRAAPTACSRRILESGNTPPHRRTTHRRLQHPKRTWGTVDNPSSRRRTSESARNTDRDALPVEIAQLPRVAAVYTRRDRLALRADRRRAASPPVHLDRPL